MNLIEKLNHSDMKMTSLEISELVGKRHDNVKRTIETLVDQCVIVRPQFEDVHLNDAMGRVRISQTYIFKGEQGKRDSIIVVAQLCPEFTAKLVDRWQELEKQVAKPKELSRMDLIQIAYEAESENIALRGELKIAAPKAQALDTIADTANTYCLRECAKTIGIQEKDLIQLLIDKKWVYRDSDRKLQPHAQFAMKGVFTNRTSPVIKNQYDGKERVFLHMRVTAFGLTRITGLVNKTKKEKNVA